MFNTFDKITKETSDDMESRNTLILIHNKSAGLKLYSYLISMTNKIWQRWKRFICVEYENNEAEVILELQQHTIC